MYKEFQGKEPKLRMGRSGAVALAVSFAAILAACGGGGGEETFKLTQGEAAAVFTPIGDATGESSTPPGSGFALSAPLLDSSKKTVGEVNVICMATKPSEGIFSVCTGTADVPGGQLALVSGGQVGPGHTVSIVGGTGKYKGASGTVDFADSAEGFLMTFNVSLP